MSSAVKEVGRGFKSIGDEVSRGFKKIDPFDLSGEKAEKAANKVNAINEEAAAAGIALNEAQLAEIERLTAPFRGAATGVALPQLSALAIGGGVDFQPSELSKVQLEQGREGIIQGQAAKSGIKSSDTFSRLSDLVSGVAAEDVGRFERGQAALLETGRGAEAGLTGAGTRLSGNISDLLSNLGSRQQITAQNLGSQKIAAGQTAGNTLTSLANLALLSK